MGSHRDPRFLGLIVVIFIALSLTAADAAIVTITTLETTYPPTAASGWAVARVSGAGGSISRNMPKGDPGPLPPASFYFKVGYNTSLPGQAWLGTNNYFGLKLTDIKRMQYSSYLVQRGEESTPPSFYPYQPIQLQLHTYNPSVTSEQHYLMFRPWGKADGGDPSGSHCRVWETWDCMSDAYQWYDPQGLFVGGVWRHWWKWSEIVAYMPYLCISKPSVGNGFPSTTPTGCGLNFVIGARNETSNGQMTPDFPLTAWWREGYNAEGSMDQFIMAVRKSDGTIKENTFDFDLTSPAQRPPVRALNNRATAEAFWLDGDTSSPCGAWTAAQILARLTPIQRSANTNASLFVVYGNVVADPAPNGAWFSIDDGAGLKIPVYAPGSSVMVGDYVRVKGGLVPPMPYDWGAPRGYDRVSSGGSCIPNTSTQPYLPTFELEMHSTGTDVTVYSR